MTEKEKNQLIGVGFIICLILITILTAYTIINTKSLDKLIQRVETLEGTNQYSGSANEGLTVFDSSAQAADGYSTADFKAIKPSDIAKESKNKTIVVLWARQTCGYCVAYVPLITEVAKNHDVVIRYIDMATVIDINTWKVKDEKELNILSSLKGKGEYSKFAAQAVEGTPSTYFIKDGKIINGILGYVEKSTIEAKFKEVGL